MAGHSLSPRVLRGRRATHQGKQRATLFALVAGDPMRNSFRFERFGFILNVWPDASVEAALDWRAHSPSEIQAARQHGQHVWLDHFSRSPIGGGGLQRLIDDYDAGRHRALDADRDISNRALAGRLIVEDIRWRLTSFDR
jgi:hypothetical protein